MIFSQLHTYEKWQINVTRAINLPLLHITDMALSATIAMNFNHAPYRWEDSVETAQVLTLIPEEDVGKCIQNTRPDQQD